jgi:hypothetical protein
VVIIGQITNFRRPAKHIGNVRVTLLDGDRVVVRAFANDRGGSRSNTVIRAEHDWHVDRIRPRRAA